MRKLFIGHTRFSVHQYNSGSFKATRQGNTRRFDEDEYTQWLYSAERLGPRTEIFVEESLPQLAASSEVCDLVHVVHYSASLPDKYQQKLREAARQYPFIHLNEAPGIVAPSSPSKKVLNHVLKGRLPEDGVFGIYRLDDDDVLPVNFFERMNPYVVEEHVGWRVSFPESLTAIRTRSEYILPWSRYFPKAAAGLVSVHQKTSDGTIHGLQTRAPTKGHMKLDTVHPTILDSREPGFFQARHKSQDSILGSGPTPFFSTIVPPAMTANPVSPHLFDEYFPFVARRIRRNVGELASKLSVDNDAFLNRTEGMSVTIDSVKPQLLLAEVECEGSEPASINVEIAVVRDETISESSVEAYMSAAGLTRGRDDVYHGTVQFGDELSCGSFVLETPPGCKVASVRFSSGEPVRIASLRAYQLS